MTIRERLKRLLDDGNLIELYFAPSNNYYLAKVTRVGEDYVEFDAYDEEENIVAHNIMPLQLLMGITTTSTERNREKLELLFRKEFEGESRRGNP